MKWGARGSGPPKRGVAYGMITSARVMLCHPWPMIAVASAIGQVNFSIINGNLSSNFSNDFNWLNCSSGLHGWGELTLHYFKKRTVIQYVVFALSEPLRRPADVALGFAARAARSAASSRATRPSASRAARIASHPSTVMVAWMFRQSVFDGWNDRPAHHSAPALGFLGRVPLFDAIRGVCEEHEARAAGHLRAAPIESFCRDKFVILHRLADDECRAALARIIIIVEPEVVRSE